jgi:hypothetical protein
LLRAQASHVHHTAHGVRVYNTAEAIIMINDRSSYSY